MKTWVFDLDGTLVDSLTVHFLTLETIFNENGLEFSKQKHEEVLKVTAKTLPAYFEKYFGPEGVEPGLKRFRELSIKYFETILPFEGIEDVLKILKSKNAQIAVWTARDMEATNFLLKHTGLDSYFSFCVTGSCVENCKPNPEGLQRISKYFGTAQDFVMVGDHENDMMGAKSFGAKAVRAKWDATMKNVSCHLSDWQFTDTAAFKNWIQETL